MKTRSLLFAALSLGMASAALAQLGGLVPPVGGVVDAVPRLTDNATGLVDGTARSLADARLDRLTDLVRAHPREIALDDHGDPARAGEVTLVDPPADLVAAASAHGYRVIERADALGVGYVRLEIPGRTSLKAAIKELRSLGAAVVSADPLHFQSGAGSGAAPVANGAGPSIGMIDGGVAGDMIQRGFASGAPRASDHGTAVASLIAGRGRIRGAAPGAKIYAADVYGSDPAGGSATAIVQALAWLVVQKVPVVTISLVGPSNPLLARVIAAAQARGTIIVAAVGNDGPASPPSYPASYPGVIAVTGVNARKQILIEAGRATHLDYAAPGADMLAANARGGFVAVRGTSFAAPLVAAKLAQNYRAPDPARRAVAIAAVDASAQRLGPRYGRGLVCGDCTTPK